jgi:protein N-lysine methyltransferase METTL21D
MCREGSRAIQSTMFFYLSFLRPLPHSSDTSNNVSITPQIANDLRTFHLEEEVDIFYTWSSSLADCTGSNISSMARKLTTWRKSSMYKNLSIPLPANAKPGQEWRLLLSCGAHSTSASFMIDFGGNGFGARPFPVISMPLLLDVRMAKNKPTGKQEQIERLYSIPSRSSEKQSTILCIREQTSFELDKVNTTPASCTMFLMLGLQENLGQRHWS